MLQLRSLLEWIMGILVALVCFSRSRRTTADDGPRQLLSHAELGLAKEQTWAAAGSSKELDLAKETALLTLLIGTSAMRGWLVLRALLYWCFLAGWWLALASMPIGDATTVVYCGPIFTAIFSRVFLGERIEWSFYPTVALDAAGLLLIARPAFLFSSGGTAAAGPTSSAAYSVGMGCALFSAIVAGLLPVCTRISKSCSWTAVNHVSSALAAWVFTPMAICVWCALEPSASAQLVSALGSVVSSSGASRAAGLVRLESLLGATLCGFAGLALQTLGYQREEAAKASLMTILEIPFACLLQFVFFHDELTLLSLTGIALIVSGTLINLLRQLSAASRVVAEPAHQSSLSPREAVAPRSNNFRTE